MPLPKEAREGLERAWLQVLSERYPSVKWVIVEEIQDPDEVEDDGKP